MTTANAKFEQFIVTLTQCLDSIEAVDGLVSERVQPSSSETVDETKDVIKSLEDHVYEVWLMLHCYYQQKQKLEDEKRKLFSNGNIGHIERCCNIKTILEFEKAKSEALAKVKESLDFFEEQYRQALDEERKENEELAHTLEELEPLKDKVQSDFSDIHELEEDDSELIEFPLVIETENDAHYLFKEKQDLYNFVFALGYITDGMRTAKQLSDGELGFALQITTKYRIDSNKHKPIRSKDKQLYRVHKLMTN